MLPGQDLGKTDMIKFPVSELIDRLCIARLKWEKTRLNAEELEWYEQEWRKLPETAELEPLVQRLSAVHREIWNLEWQLKSGVEHELGLEEIGKRAIKIRDWNNQRIRIKNEAADRAHCPIREIKQDHLSE
jgi:hypothetical protein